ncbi:dihydroxyacetone kinase subunit L [Actinomyces sp. 186855]|nr:MULTISPECIES: dihydroxyacetone kinase subunit L [unclassified Actinomyces]MCL3777192.1 dihydroxyacetone kinase subunit L [Actinomyces sp. AC-20-1]MCL3788984.1 dihydroxyacetone kinase subunit L [Actinomyces sp. 187325]MCL3791339.1 dihydroxyacetone kinase subunit L [Actinomyces sp. 186855]MCL3793950.1 dihydroxyacetone kinase subunit L [Actinomyces sp. 217892]
MTDNREYLVSLDQVNGDGDLGISMDDGFGALAGYLSAAEETDLGQLLRQGGKVFNEAAPSSLGTILTFGLMGMARALKGRQEADLPTVVEALDAGVANIMAKAESGPGQKTIVDALVPGVAVLREGVASTDGDRRAVPALWRAAAEAAAQGSESTRQMEAVHGRAAYSASRSVGVLDGGSVVGRLIFEGIAGACEAG